MMALVFAYGSLMYKPVLTALLQRVPVTRPATLAGYERRVIAGRVYPAILPSADPHASVEGVLLEGLDEYEQLLLDEYEDDSYQVVLAPAARPQRTICRCRPSVQHDIRCLTARLSGQTHLFRT